MARATTTNQQISGTYAVQKNQTKFSMAGWIRRGASGSLQAFGFDNGDSAHQILIWHFTDNAMYFIVRNGSTPFGSVAQNVTGWNHWALVFDGSQTGNSNRLKGYLNGSALTLAFTGTVGTTTSNNAAIDIFRVGRVVAGNYWSTGDFAEIGMWQEALSDSDVAALSKGMTPDKVRPDKLVSYIPLVRDIQDVRSGTALTDTSTTVSNHPRVYA
jgi:hypothetical protein